MSETVLLVGGGGREHAIARAVADSDEDVELYAAASNKNPGIAELSSGFVTVDETDADAIVDYATSVGATLAVIGPESALEAGVVDALDDAGIYAFGPREAEARIETDKAYQREFMRENDIPGTPDFQVFDDAEEAAETLRRYEGDMAIKPRGLTGGKGVRVTGDQLTTEEGVEYILESDYEEFVLEERLVGEELTVQAFVANGSVLITPAVQDHKRAYEGDEGPNTGGMGSYTDASFQLPFMTEVDSAEALTILKAVIDELPAYKGILYGQFMLTEDGLKVVEFNARFGDPEAMNTLPALETDFVEILQAARDRQPMPEISFAEKATVVKYAVPEGYPTDPEDGATVTIDDEVVADVSDAYDGEALLFYASVDDRDDGIYTTTSRSYAVVGIADTIAEAEEIAEAALERAGTEGLRVRHDIGKADLVQSRVDHAEELRGD
ncbi:phosphoribosylamine--glycine ligase [Salinarchaeum sp. Harcht-Bsk1]|uniref:phosphoribosylamine--glycine ligase n=1 Tax=Salinarchaeum sp. Harcht-Bsk1 TaxID=1333523 RepID=UPI000342290F|nr:phosphoribosylamine--glycine ligase [Salinarchaeum sp. Harcht-Bsk1]AGN02888.1 phosphoribosylamine--glycine ligase [Salinarchaeum sp. Harcht-Bsk1]